MRGARSTGARGGAVAALLADGWLMSSQDVMAARGTEGYMLTSLGFGDLRIELRVCLHARAGHRMSRSKRGSRRRGGQPAWEITSGRAAGTHFKAASASLT